MNNDKNCQMTPPDRVSKITRSQIMSQVRSTGNRSTELRLRAYLVRYALRGWCIQPQGIIGNPDFAFKPERIAIFVDGAFWHGAPGFGRFPKSRLDYWTPKIERNKQRDREVSDKLTQEGWIVLRFWDYQLADDPNAVIATIKGMLRSRRAGTDGAGQVAAGAA